MVLFSFFVFKFKIASFTVFLEGLVLLPILNTLLQPLFHETGISCNFVNLSSSHLLQHAFTSLSFFTITLLCKLILSHLLIIKFLLVTFH